MYVCRYEYRASNGKVTGKALDKSLFNGHLSTSAICTELAAFYGQLIPNGLSFMVNKLGAA